MPNTKSVKIDIPLIDGGTMLCGGGKSIDASIKVVLLRKHAKLLAAALARVATDDSACEMVIDHDAVNCTDDFQMDSDDFAHGYRIRQRVGKIK